MSGNSQKLGAWSSQHSLRQFYRLENWKKPHLVNSSENVYFDLRITHKGLGPADPWEAGKTVTHTMAKILSRVQVRVYGQLSQCVQRQPAAVFFPHLHFHSQRLLLTYREAIAHLQRSLLSPPSVLYLTNMPRFQLAEVKRIQADASSMVGVSVCMSFLCSLPSPPLAMIWGPKP